MSQRPDFEKMPREEAILHLRHIRNLLISGDDAESVVLELCERLGVDPKAGANNMREDL